MAQPQFTVTDLNSNSSSTPKIDANGRGTWTPLANDIGGHTFVITATANSQTLSTQFVVRVVPAGQGPAQPTNVQQPAAQKPATPSTASATLTGKSSGYVFTTYMGVGSSGAAVTALQNKLTALGLYQGPVTGYYGNLTAAAVKKFQKANGLDQFGYVGPGTRAALNK